MILDWIDRKRRYFWGAVGMCVISFLLLMIPLKEKGAINLTNVAGTEKYLKHVEHGTNLYW